VRAGSLVADGLWIGGNRAEIGGGLYVGAGAEVELAHVTMTDNEAEARGGGYAVDAGGLLVVAGGTSSCNVATYEGGALWVGEGEVRLDHVTSVSDRGCAPASEACGAIFHVEESGTLDVEDTVVDQHAAEVTALWAAGPTTLAWSNVASLGTRYAGDVTEGEGMLDQGGNVVGVTCDGEPGGEDLHLVAGAASVDAGDPADGLDPDGSAPDQGAYGGPAGDW
jgi:hypothetical protein